VFKLAKTSKEENTGNTNKYLNMK